MLAATRSSCADSFSRFVLSEVPDSVLHTAHLLNCNLQQHAGMSESWIAIDGLAY